MAGDRQPGGGDASEDAEAARGAASPEPAFVFLDPLLGEEQRAALAQGLGVRLRALHPAEIAEQPVQATDLAVVVALELGLYSGLDAVEHLRRGGCRCPIALASAAPTRALVRAARRAGATTVISQPYDLDELRQRLALAPVAAPAAGAGAAGTAAGVSS